MLTMDFPGFKVMGAEKTDNIICVTLVATDDIRPCPDCGSASRRVHSKYVRRLRDLPIQGQCVHLHVVIRRFRCATWVCRRRTFAESVLQLAQRYAQRTDRVTNLLKAMILKLSCRTGSNLVALIGIRVSARTLLRTVDQSQRTFPTPRVLGVDDFALRRGMTYATLLCDMETGRPVDVLPGRTSKELKDWLCSHPGVEVIVRDRASAYAQAASAGAPSAIQVADRFHLVKNVSDALREVIDRKPWELPVWAEISMPVPERKTPAGKLPKRQEQLLAATVERRGRRYDEIQNRMANGESLRAIGRNMGLSRATVRKYGCAQGVPVRALRRQLKTELDNHTAYLSERWVAGCHNASQLFRELQMLGYPGSSASVRRFLKGWRDPFHPEIGQLEPHHPRSNGPTWREIRWSVLCPPEHLGQQQASQLSEFLALHSDLTDARELVQRFRTMLRNQDLNDFDPWLIAAADSGLAPFQRLARTLHKDRAAVLAGIELRWSTGPIEGHITRVKLIKRLGYGRAGLDLLRARITGVA